jgi:hypothetical protein
MGKIVISNKNKVTCKTLKESVVDFLLGVEDVLNNEDLDELYFNNKEDLDYYIIEIDHNKNIRGYFTDKDELLAHLNFILSRITNTGTEFIEAEEMHFIFNSKTGEHYNISITEIELEKSEDD